jgi:flagellin
MTRINTNVSSLTAQKTLAQSNAALQQALTRLSTGLRINSGKDDPAGLIASEALGSDIISTQKAISNGTRASQMIATADSALGQVGALLNDIRGLITEAGNTGAMSADQIAANQLQVDSSLDALNRISQVTSFQGKRLLDGSLDFIKTDVSGMTTVNDLQIDSANLGTTGTLAVSVDITTAAGQAKLTDTGFTAGAQAETTLTFAAGTSVNDTGDFDVFATSLSTASGTVTLNVVTDDAKAGTAEYDGSSNLYVYILTANTTTATELETAINNTVGVKEYFQAKVTTAGVVTSDVAQLMKSATIKVQAAGTQLGATWNNVAVEVGVANTGPGVATATWDATNRRINITIDDDSVVTTAAIETAIEALTIGGVKPFVATVTTPGAARLNVYGGSGADIDAAGNTNATGGNTLYDDLVFQLSGKEGSQVFSFEGGTGVNQVINAINAQTDSTGIAASLTANLTTGAATLNLMSSAYGTEAFSAVDIISEGVLGRFGDQLSGTRDAGEDIVASVNGITASGRGNTLSINTATLAMTATVANGSSTDFSFAITGGGATFQLGPDVVTAQQSRIGIQSVNTAKLGGQYGRLYQLASGGSASLVNSPTTAGRIVDEVLTKVGTLRGRLGAFQKTTVDVNTKTLTDTVENLTAAQSSIRDTDFAAESASLTRAQILVQSGTAVLAIANQGPQAVLRLLQ